MQSDKPEDKQNKLLDNIPGLKTSKGVKRTFNISWWKVLLGLILSVAGLIGAGKYLSDYSNMVAGGIAIFGLGPGIILIWLGLSKFKTSFMFYQGKEAPNFTGKENSLILFAQRINGKDSPLMIKVTTIEHPPKGARLHYVKNWRRHFYELYNDTKENKLKPVVMPDKKSFPPELYKIPAMMQPVKDYLEYSPPSALQKWGPGILIGAMVVVGIFMIMTLGA